MNRNRAKCAKCLDVIESIQVRDFVWCKCKTIFIDGGNGDHGGWRFGGDFASFIRIDDDGNEIPVAVQKDDTVNPETMKPQRKAKNPKFDPYAIYGRDQLMITAAHRYYLGRSAYIVDDCCRWLKAHWENLNEDVRKRIIEETEEAIEKGCAGMEMDVETWKQLMSDIK